MWYILIAVGVFGLAILIACLQDPKKKAEKPSE
jgi:hypothetical protein